ncbi:MAG: sensor histidine kinase, partial [Phycisphaerales bacterium]
ERARARAIAQLSEVTAGMAHEINNPLAIVSGRSQLLASRLKNYKDKSDAQEVADAAHRVSDLVTRLHQFARPPEPNLRRIIVVDVIRLAVQMARVKAAQPARVGGERLLVPATIPDALLDPDLLSAALAEVIRNGIEAAGEHPLELCVRVDSADGRLSISVKDRGMGMSDTALAHAFDPFFSEKPAGRQVGVGLALARRFVQVMGGDILLESAPGRGTTATIFFPTWRAGAESLVPAVAA